MQSTRGNTKLARHPDRPEQCLPRSGPGWRLIFRFGTKGAKRDADNLGNLHPPYALQLPASRVLQAEPGCLGAG